MQGNRKPYILYLWIALPFIILMSIHEASTFKVSLWTTLLNNTWRTLYVMVINFLLFEFVIPFVLRRRAYIISNILIGLGLLWIFVMLWSYGLFGWRMLGVVLGVYTPLGPRDVRAVLLEAQMGFSVGSVFMFGIIRHIYHYVRLKQAAQQLSLEKKEAELNYLKSQTNPHFLFNTLNNIYALARDKNDLAPESILRLSKILRFMLYETGGRFISVEQELAVISDYIELEKLRYDESLRINFNYDIEDMRQAIPPLLLVPLVENAFKHGVSETRGRPFIDLHLSVQQRQLLFVVKNSTDASEGNQAVAENIGLANLRRQLSLLYSAYELQVERGTSIFTATLKINLASHV